MSLNITQLIDHIKDPLYRNSLFLMATTAVTTGLGFFFWMVVARYYTEYEVGVAAAIISAINLLAMISNVGLGMAIIRFLPTSEKPVELINSCFTMSAILALAASIVFIAGVDLWSPETAFVRDNWVFLLAFFLFVMFRPVSAIMDSVFVAKRRAELVLAKDATASLLKIPLPIIMVSFFHAFGIVSSMCISIGIFVLIFLFFIMPRIQRHYKPIPRINPGIVRDIWKYSAGNYFAMLFAAAPSLLLPLIVTNLVGARQNAYFYVAFMMTSVLSAIPGAVSQSLFAEGSHFEQDLAVTARRSLKFTLLLLVPAIILLMVTGKWLLLLFGENYSSNALTLLWILSLSILFMGINNIYISVLRIRGRIRELVLIRVFTALAIIIPSIIIAPIMGIMGIGYANIVARFLVSIYVLVRIRNHYHAGHL